MLLAGLFVIAPTTAHADTLITVTTTDDVVDGSDNVISLREAFDLAQGSAQPVQISLGASQTYQLTMCSGPGFNRQGLLETTTAQPVTIHGMSSTVRQTCVGRAVLRLGDPLTIGSFGALTLDSLIIDGGNGSAVGAVGAGGGLTADGITVTNTVLPGGDYKSAAVVAAGFTAVNNSTIRLTQGGAGLSVRKGGDVSTNPLLAMNKSLVTRNYNPHGGAGGVFSERNISMVDTFVELNTATGASHPSVGGVLPGDTVGVLTATGGSISSNDGYTAGAVVGVANLTGTDVADNHGYVVGGLVGQIDLDRVQLRSNTGDFIGGFAATGTIDKSLIDHNVGVAYVGAGSFSQSPVAQSLTIRRTSITNNTGGMVGGLAIEKSEQPTPPTPQPGHLDIRASTLANNVATTTATDKAAANDFSFFESNPTGNPPSPAIGTLTTQTTAFGSQHGAHPACFLDGLPVTSTGYNFSADNSCGLTPSLEDDVNGGDPMLEYVALAGAYDGGEWVLPLPAPGSRLRDRYLATFGECPGGDQRNVPTPQGPACDIGSVEAILGGYHPVAPHRVYDTRDAMQPIGPGESRTIQVEPDPDEASHLSAVVLNVTAIGPTATSHLTAYGTNQAKPPTSNLNFGAGETIPNQVVVPLGLGAEPNKIKLFNNAGATHVAIDVAGVFDNGTQDVKGDCPCGDGFKGLLTPVRAMDTRSGQGGPQAPFGPGETRTLSLANLGLPGDAEAVAVNVTVTNTDATSHLTLGPETPLPIVSNLNWTPGKTIANGATVKLGPGQTLKLRNNEGHVHVIVDVLGSYSPTEQARFVPIGPSRIRDTRVNPGTPVGPGETLDTGFPGMPGGLPGESTAVFVNVTGVQPTMTTHLTAAFFTRPPPTTSTLNLPAGGTRANLTMTPFEPGITVVSTYNNAGQTHVVLDYFGYFGPNQTPFGVPP